MSPVGDDGLVDWDGPDDPENPMNWPARKRYLHAVMVSSIALNVYEAPLQNMLL